MVRHSNRKLADELRVAEEHDFLTGLLNTRSFDAVLAAESSSGSRSG